MSSESILQAVKEATRLDAEGKFSDAYHIYIQSISDIVEKLRIQQSAPHESHHHNHHHHHHGARSESSRKTAKGLAKVLKMCAERISHIVEQEENLFSSAASSPTHSREGSRDSGQLQLPVPTISRMGSIPGSNSNSPPLPSLNPPSTIKKRSIADINDAASKAAMERNLAVMRKWTEDMAIKREKEMSLSNSKASTLTREQQEQALRQTLTFMKVRKRTDIRSMFGREPSSEDISTIDEKKADEPSDVPPKPKSPKDSGSTDSLTSSNDGATSDAHVEGVKQAAPAPVVVDPEERAKRLEKSRRYVIHELFETEVSYVRVLTILMEQFASVLIKPSAPGHRPIISDYDYKLIFSCIPKLLEFSKGLKDELEAAVNSNTDSKSVVANIFLNHVNEWQIYNDYVSNYGTALATVGRLLDDSEPFKVFMQQCRSNPETDRQDIKSFLMAPIQRVMRYWLLISELKKKTPDTDQDYQVIFSATEFMFELANMLNSAKVKEEERTGMFDVQRTVKDCPPNLVSSHRRYIACVDVLHVGTNRAGRLYLFSDLILLAKLRRVHRTILNRVGGEHGGNNPNDPESTTRKPYSFEGWFYFVDLRLEEAENQDDEMLRLVHVKPTFVAQTLSRPNTRGRSSSFSTHGANARVEPASSVYPTNGAAAASQGAFNTMTHSDSSSIHGSSAGSSGFLSTLSNSIHSKANSSSHLNLSSLVGGGGCANEEKIYLRITDKKSRLESRAAIKKLIGDAQQLAAAVPHASS